MSFAWKRAWQPTLLALASLVALAAPAHAQTIRAGAPSNGSPFNFLDAASGAWQGYMVELLQEVGRRNGLQVEFVATANPELPAALLASQIDVIASNFAITEERRAQGMEFSTPVILSNDGMLVPATDTADHASFEAFRGQVVGAIQGTTHETWLRDNATLFQEVRFYPGRAELMSAIASGEIKAARVAGPPYAYEIKVRGAFPAVRFVDSYQPISPVQGAFAVRREEADLLQRVNASIAELKANGTLATIAQRWAVPLPN